MKYGPIICDPNSEEVKALVGKKVVASDNYSNVSTPFELDPYLPILGRLVDFRRFDCRPFLVEESSGICSYTFIREVIEEKPQYRPYKDTEELVSDFCQRFGIVNTDYAIPMIWFRNKKTGRAWLVTCFNDTGVGYESMDAIFNKLTYLDGSPVGKEVKE